MKRQPGTGAQCIEAPRQPLLTRSRSRSVSCPRLVERLVAAVSILASPIAAAQQPPAVTAPNSQAGVPEVVPDSKAESTPPAAVAPVVNSDDEIEELVPLAEPPPAAADETGALAEVAAESEAQGSGAGDRILYSGYLPGYRHTMGLGTAPYSPRVGALPGAMTAGFGAPVPPSEWTFEYAGFMTASLQFSADSRRNVAEGQAESVYHVPPETVDSWGSFTSTNSIPGNWVSMRFRYGNARVSGNVSIETWNPTRPSTYYQVGSQYFLNNAYLAYSPAPVAGARIRIEAGRYSTSYGTLGRWGSGFYVNPLSGNVQGVGERIIAEYDISDPYLVVVEHGLMGTRDGQIPEQVIPGSSNGWRRQLWPGAWVHHAHVGLIREGEPRLELQGHYLRNWSQEDRNVAERDNPGTQQVDESDVRDGRITVIGGDFKLLSDAFGVFGVGGALIRGRDSFPLKGLSTYGEDGEQLTNKWWGVTSGGTGKLLVLAANYDVSLGKLVSYPEPFGGDGPDVVINTGVHWTKTWSEFDGYDGRTRHKYGIDALYTFIEYMGAGLRLDRVVPTSYRDSETYHVIAPRLQLRSSWNSHEAIQLIYAKWFYGSETRNEGTGLRTPEQLDDQLFALNFNMWW